MKNENYESLTESERQYKASFVGAYRQPYAVQQTGKGWKTRHKKLSDKVIKAHLNCAYWIGTTAAWYPSFYSLDIDNPTPKQLERIYERFDRHGIRESQRLAMTTPSYEKYGNQRIYLRLEYKGKIPTWRLGHAALWNLGGRLCEVYPQQKRKDRLPCGANQDILTEDGIRLTHLDWQTEMHFLQKLDAVAVETLPMQPELFEQPQHERDEPQAWRLRKDVRELYESGLQSFGTRHEAQWILLEDLWRTNYFQAEAVRIVKRWIRRKHNGFSRSANKNQWQAIDEEIQRQAVWIWARPRQLPDAPHNLQGQITRPDLEWITKLFPGDAVKQKQLFKLASYCRARKQHEWIYISKQIWANDIAHETTYRKLQQELEGRGVMRSVNQYKKGEYSHRYKLDLPQTDEPPLMRDERNVDGYFEALQMTFSWREISELARLSVKTMYRHFGGKKAR